MKAKKIVALVAGFAVAATMAVGLSACGKKGPQPLGKTTLNLADYAMEYEEDSQKGFTSLNFLAEGKNITRDGEYLIIHDNSKYSVCDMADENLIFENLSGEPSYTTIGSFPVWQVRSESSSYYNYNYTYYDKNGQQILDDGEYSSLDCSSVQAYVGTEAKTSTVYVITGKKANGSGWDDVKVYLRLVEDETTGKVSYTIVSESDVKTYGPGYAVGSNISASLESIYEADEDYPVEGDIKDYKYNKLGNVITFYKGTEKTGSVDLTENGEKLAFVGNCIICR